MRNYYLALLVFSLLGCATIERKPNETVSDFCSEWALMRPSIHTYRYWYTDCLKREYRRMSDAKAAAIP